MLGKIESRVNKILLLLQLIPLGCFVTVLILGVIERDIFALLISSVMTVVSIRDIISEYKYNKRAIRYQEEKKKFQEILDRDFK